MYKYPKCSALASDKMFEKYMKWSNEKVKKLDVMDVKCIKWSAAVFTLMLAKLWPVLLGLDWYWYGLMGIIFMWKPMKKCF